ncbi:MAG: DUF177 domain-containing protein [Novosphingobium sp.]|uniref:YceD family protein n=1 Tax=Novosphingobium sp. TaxID=1874826 RepID=UPI0032BC4E64
MSEFERIVDAARLPVGAQIFDATTKECAALAQRFGLAAVHSLTATVSLAADGPVVRVTGTVKASAVQSCAISGDDLPVQICEPVALRFVPQYSAAPNADEVELSAEELDEIEMDGTRFDLGEALAQTMALGIDPYAEGPGAEEARRKAGLLDPSQAGPLAGLRDLFKK